MSLLRFFKIIQFTFANLHRIIMFWQLKIKIKSLIKYLYDTFVQSIFYFKFWSHARSQMYFSIKFYICLLTNVHLENDTLI